MRCLFTLGLALVMLLHSATSVAAQGASNAKLEELVVAAHFYVVSYTIWPGNTELKICVAEKHSLSEGLRSLFSNRSTVERKLEVVGLSQEMKGSDNCDAAVLGDNSEENKLVLEHFRDRPVLTLSSEADITTQGGMIFLPRGKPPRILLRRVAQSGLKIDSALLAISEIVQ